ncbi:hypothetical protein V8G54_001780 [Vigna mungo]|uniref:Uncharacterized protein n=1 Tax=Vigna mungo TaxID=3915 RepID=A0AAQ3SBU3_VIGMU
MPRRRNRVGRHSLCKTGSEPEKKEGKKRTQRRTQNGKEVEEEEEQFLRHHVPPRTSPGRAISTLLPGRLVARRRRTNNEGIGFLKMKSDYPLPLRTESTKNIGYFTSGPSQLRHSQGVRQRVGFEPRSYSLYASVPLKPGQKS